LFAHALNDTLTAGEDPRDGKRMTARMWNRIFPGKLLLNNKYSISEYVSKVN